jgi:4,5-DOPA dioxygenase extradiol
MSNRTPAIFVAHGAPTLAIEHDAYTEKLGQAGKRLSGARGVVIISAHWQSRPPVRVNVVEKPSMIYDFGGFDDALYRIQYRASGSSAIANEVIDALRDAGVQVEAEASRGWDHGVWVPLLHLLPNASLPVVEVSLPYGAPPADLIALGAALRPLRDRGIAIIGSGGIVHNLRELEFGDKDAPPVDWAAAFDTWVASRVAKRDVDALTKYRSTAPNAARAVPTDEHFAPLFVILGATDEGDRMETVHEGFQYGTLSTRSLAFG